MTNPVRSAPFSSLLAGFAQRQLLQNRSPLSRRTRGLAQRQTTTLWCDMVLLPRRLLKRHHRGHQRIQRRSSRRFLDASRHAAVPAPADASN
jgi:hypothetical protein